MMLPAACRAAAVEVDADFPGGNVIVERIDGDNIHVRPDLRDTVGDWFYWNFRVRGAAGRTITVHFTKGNPIGVRGPAVSIDGGKSWSGSGPTRCATRRSITRSRRTSTTCASPSRFRISGTTSTRSSIGSRTTRTSA